jgi:type IV secretion system protein VirB9
MNCLNLAAGIGLLTLTATPILAETTSKPGRYDPRVTYASYQPGQVYNVYTALRTVTLVEVGDGERIQSIAIGDLESFKIDRLEGQNLFIIKPTASGVSTNLSVETNRNIYFLNLVSTSRRSPMYSVKFTVPGTKAAAGTGAPALPSAPLKYTILKKRKMPGFVPLEISDDGFKTTFRIPDDAPIPTIFRADDKGREYSVNAAVRGTRITVSTRSARWVLRFGDDYLCIEGHK